MQIRPNYFLLVIIICVTVSNFINLFSRTFEVIRGNMVGYQRDSELSPSPYRRVGKLNSTPSPPNDRSTDADLFLK